MKILIKQPKEFAIAIAVVIMNAINIYQAIKTKSFNEDYIVAFLVAIFSLIGLYYNIPTSEENAKYTGMMRLEKEQNKGIITGEDFTDDLDDEEDEEDEEGDGLGIFEEATEETNDGPDDWRDD